MSTGGGPLLGEGGFFGRGGDYGPRGPYGAWPGCGCGSLLIILAGIAGVSLAAVYHHARDIFPHNPVRRVRFLEGGRAFFNPDPARYNPDGIRPVTSSYSPEWDALAKLRAATRARDMSLHGFPKRLSRSETSSGFGAKSRLASYITSPTTAILPVTPSCSSRR